MKHVTVAPQSAVRTERPALTTATQALAGFSIDQLRIDMFGDMLYVNGLAACYDAKQQATRRLVEALPGVAIINELRVAHSFSNDAEIARAVTSAIARIATGASARITVDVEDGEVHLRGTALDQAEAAAIEAAAWASPGVRHVHRRMSCQKAVEPRQIELALAEYITRSAGVPGEAVAVRYDHGIVRLTGTVITAQQREAIEDLVRWHELVSDVVNQLRIVPPGGAS